MAASKSPPAVVHRSPGKKVCSHVASPGLAEAPPPSPPDAFEVPSPQFDNTRWAVVTAAVDDPIRDTNNRSVTLFSVDSGGMAPARSMSMWEATAIGKPVVAAFQMPWQVLR